MNKAMTGSDETVRLTMKRARVQRWLVNQRNARKTLEMMQTLTADGTPDIMAWALHYANKSRSPWKQTVGQEDATWSCMESITLGLFLELEIGLYFEEIYAWHNRPGPINKRPGFLMLEIFQLYLGFEVQTLVE